MEIRPGRGHGMPIAMGALSYLIYFLDQTVPVSTCPYDACAVKISGSTALHCHSAHRLEKAYMLRPCMG
jgi:hypothetical protein